LKEGGGGKKNLTPGDGESGEKATEESSVKNPAKLLSDRGWGIGFNIYGEERKK